MSNTSNILERIKRLEENKDYIKELLDVINTNVHLIKIEIDKFTKYFYQKEKEEKPETPEINELIEKFRNLKTNPKPIKNKLNLFYSKDDILLKSKQRNI